MDRILAAEIIPESVWTSEDEPPRRLDQDAGRKIFQEAMKSLPQDLPEAGPQRENFIMGCVMSELRGKIPGRTVRTWVKEELA